MDQLGMGLLQSYRAYEPAGRLRSEAERRPSPRPRVPRRAPRRRVRRP
jgi:hypothetical protein